MRVCVEGKEGEGRGVRMQEMASTLSGHSELCSSIENIEICLTKLIEKNIDFKNMTFPTQTIQNKSTCFQYVQAMSNQVVNRKLDDCIDTTVYHTIEYRVFHIHLIHCPVLCTRPP